MRWYYIGNYPLFVWSTADITNGETRVYQFGGYNSGDKSEIYCIALNIDCASVSTVIETTTTTVLTSTAEDNNEKNFTSVWWITRWRMYLGVGDANCRTWFYC